MNGWTFLDRHVDTLAIAFIVALCFAFGTCGDGKGCRLQCGDLVRIQTAPMGDGGAP